MSLSLWLAFFIAAWAISFSPGPGAIAVMSASLNHGFARGCFATFGLILGFWTQLVVVAVGLGAVIATSALAFAVVKWLGVAYLVYVGIRTLTRPAPALDVDRPGTTTRRAFVQGVAVNVLNPKVALFFLSFLPQFIHPADGRAGTQALVLGLVFVVIGCITDTCYSLAASSLRGVLLRGRALPFVRRWVAGVMFLGLGLMAATASASSGTSTTK